MKVIHIEQAATLGALEPWGSTGLPDTTPVQLSGRRVSIPGQEHIDTGVFECTTGTYRRSVKQAEIMHFLTGHGSFTPDGEDTLHFRAGDTFFFQANTEGTWVIDAVMRKLYVILG